MKKIYVSENIHFITKEYLKQLGYNLDIVNSTNHVYGAVSSHADIYMCKLGTNPESPIYVGDKQELGFAYPENIRFNGACLHNIFMHNLAHTSKDLLTRLEAEGFTLIHVKQGYTKCNVVVVDHNSLITSDQGIIKAIKQWNCNYDEKERLDALEVSPGHVKLEGFPYGFLGGASGRVGEEIIFHGDLSAHPDFEKIVEFIERKELKVKYFPEFPLEDIGSIMEHVLK